MSRPTLAHGSVLGDCDKLITRILSGLGQRDGFQLEIRANIASIHIHLHYMTESNRHEPIPWEGERLRAGAIRLEWKAELDEESSGVAVGVRSPSYNVSLTPHSLPSPLPLDLVSITPAISKRPPLYLRGDLCRALEARVERLASEEVLALHPDN